MSEIAPAPSDAVRRATRLSRVRVVTHTDNVGPCVGTAQWIPITIRWHRLAHDRGEPCEMLSSALSFRCSSGGLWQILNGAAKPATSSGLQASSSAPRL